MVLLIPIGCEVDGPVDSNRLWGIGLDSPVDSYRLVVVATVTLSSGLMREYTVYMNIDTEIYIDIWIYLGALYPSFTRRKNLSYKTSVFMQINVLLKHF